METRSRIATSSASDTETGPYYYRARYYDQSVGRFLTEDPIRPDNAIDSYSYVSNSPTNFTDPRGLYQTDPEVPKPIPPRLDTFMKCMDGCTHRDQYVTATTNEHPDNRHKDPGHAGGTSIDIRPVGTPSKGSNGIFCCAQQCGAVFVLDERTTKFHYHIQLEMTILPRGTNMIPHTPECEPKGCDTKK